MSSSSIIFLQKARYHSYLWLNNTPLVYMSYFLYPFICWWAPMLIPNLSCCCNKTVYAIMSFVCWLHYFQIYIYSEVAFGINVRSQLTKMLGFISGSLILILFHSSTDLFLYQCHIYWIIWCFSFIYLFYIRNLHTVFHSAYSNLHPYWQYIRVLFSPHLHQPLLFKK